MTRGCMAGTTYALWPVCVPAGGAGEEAARQVLGTGEVAACVCGVEDWVFWRRAVRRHASLLGLCRGGMVCGRLGQHARLIVCVGGHELDDLGNRVKGWEKGLPRLCAQRGPSMGWAWPFLWWKESMEARLGAEAAVCVTVGDGGRRGGGRGSTCTPGATGKWATRYRRCPATATATVGEVWSHGSVPISFV
mgnify:CR=1 FL=1